MSNLQTVVDLRNAISKAYAQGAEIVSGVGQSRLASLLGMFRQYTQADIAEALDTGKARESLGIPKSDWNKHTLRVQLAESKSIWQAVNSDPACVPMLQDAGNWSEIVKTARKIRDRSAADRAHDKAMSDLEKQVRADPRYQGADAETIAAEVAARMMALEALAQAENAENAEAEAERLAERKNSPESVEKAVKRIVKILDGFTADNIVDILAAVRRESLNARDAVNVERLAVNQ